MPNQTSSKPLPRAFALLAVALLAMCALGGVMASEDADAFSTGSQSSPLSSFSISVTDMCDIDTKVYIYVGSSFRISTANSTQSDALSGTYSSYGLSKSSSGISGTISKEGSFYVEAEAPVHGTITVYTISKGTPVTSISLQWTLSSSSTVFVGSTTSIRAICSPSNASDMTVTWSLSNGCATISREWNDTYNNVYRNGVDIQGVSPGTVTLTATANDGSGVSKSVSIKVTNPTYTYCLNFDMNGGEGGPDDMRQDAGDKTSNLKFTIPYDKPTKSGYTFAGWSKTSNASTASYQPGDSIYVDYNDVTLYAVWKENKQNYYAYLNYNANGGSGAPSSQSDSIYASSASGSKTFTISSTKPTRSGYEFQGWSTSSGSSTASYQPGSTISVSYGSSVTLYAVWKQTYTSTLNFNANGGTGAPSALTYTGTSTSAHTFTIPSTTPSKSGFIFMGWSESGSATTASYQPNSTISVPYNGSKTLYAVWQAADLDITSEPATKSLKVGQSWSYTPTTNVSGCTVTVSGADWLSVSDGKISGTPTTAGTYNVTVTVSKTGYNSDSQTFALKVYSSLGFNSVPGANGMFAFAE